MATKSTEPNFATNLRRLLLFEHHTGKDAAGTIGVDVATVSRWLTGKRYPSAVVPIAIERCTASRPASSTMIPLRLLSDSPIPSGSGTQPPCRRRQVRER